MSRSQPTRPTFAEIDTAAEFNRWYWLKAELVEYCTLAGLPTTGNKQALRERIAYALEHGGALKPEPPKPKTYSRFNWAKATLTPETVITDNVSFGPNFRGFMQTQVERKFSCTSEFMDWVKANTGATLRDAADYWKSLQARRQDPTFRRDIARDNQFNQYTRDFLDDNPSLKPTDARRYWLRKRALPAPDGRVRYEQSDLSL